MEISATKNLQKTPLQCKKICHNDPKLLNSAIKRHARLKNDSKILKLYSEMEQNSNFHPDNLNVPLVLKSCARLQAVQCGIKIHFELRNTDLINDVRVLTALIDFYCKCGMFDHARQVFDEMPDRDLASWNAMIGGYAANFLYEDAIELFRRMQRVNPNMKPNSITLVSLLSVFADFLELKLGKETHCYCLRNGFFYSNVHVGTSLIGFYSRFNVRFVRFVFDSMNLRSVVTWNATISGYYNAGEFFEALRMFVQMQFMGIEPDPVTILIIIQSCTYLGVLELGKNIHQFAIKFGFFSDKFVENALINLYAKCGSFECAYQLFARMPTRDIASWNAMIYAYNHYGNNEEALNLFTRMQLEGIRANLVTVSTMLPICAQHSCLKKGKELHAYIIKNGMELNASVGNALLSMYGDFNCVEAALYVFDGIVELNIISWNTMILVLIHAGFVDQARDHFKQLVKTETRPNSFTMVALLTACVDKTFFKLGKSIHGYIIRYGFEIDSSLCTALTDMYMDCGDEKMSRFLFENFPDRDAISWNAMIAGYIRNGRPNEALILFHQMFVEAKPNLVTMINLLALCAYMAALPQGRCVHGYIVRKEFDLGFDVSVGNSLITMYAKCGSIENAERVFHRLRKRDIISWNSILAGYGMHGFGEEAILIFTQMQKAGLKPTDVTFVSLLSTCSHCGLEEKGWEYFYSMDRDYNIEPKVVHYACIVDLLGRAGHLEEARKFINSMPLKPDASLWRALLGACRIYHNVKLARWASKKLFELEPLNIGNYILLSNIHAAVGEWEDVEKLRAQIKEKGLKKTPGRSWIVIRNQVWSFVAGDKSHPQSEEIYKKLSDLIVDIMGNGYVPDTTCVLHDVEDGDKDQRLFSHSEKLAIVFGLINTGARAPILITKNLRICSDCHSFSKFVSKFVIRKIIIRDANRFHQFVDGACSCKDYW